MDSVMLFAAVEVNSYRINSVGHARLIGLRPAENKLLAWGPPGGASLALVPLGP